MRYIIRSVILVRFIITTALGDGRSYINLHCRDNNNKPVDWWYIYKPSHDVLPYLELGEYFNYITPDTPGRWMPSEQHLTSNSMLFYTLAPVFRPTYANYLAIVQYGRKNGGSGSFNRGSSVFGILLADEVGGVWISHTVPEFPDLSKDRLKFPPKESAKGHMFACFSLDLVTLNRIGAMLKQIAPNFVNVKVPTILKPYLPDWVFLKQPSHPRAKSANSPSFSFKTTEGTLRGMLLLRVPGETHCLYKKFAKVRGLVLDVYGHTEHSKPVCHKDYSVRNINTISFKSPEQVYYINNKTDKAGFAVSTAAHWQRLGANHGKYWACVSNPSDAHGRETLIVCVEDYNVWLSFDNLKIKEPQC